MASGQSSRTVRGKYQLTPNVFVACFLHIVEANDQGMQAFVGLKRHVYGNVPPGTRLFFENGEGSEGMAVQSFSVVVQSVQETDGSLLHLCSAIEKRSRADLRAQARVPVEFSVGMPRLNAAFVARNGCHQGLMLEYASNRAMLSLAFNQQYEFTVRHKEENYALTGEIRHIQYNWLSHRHRVGVHFPQLDKAQEVILNLMLNPDYVVPISTNQTVDTAQGKISLDE